MKEPFDWHKGSAHGCLHLQNLEGVSKLKDQDRENGQCRVTSAKTLQVIQTYLKAYVMRTSAEPDRCPGEAADGGAARVVPSRPTMIVVRDTQHY